MQGLHVDHRFWFGLRGVPKNISRNLKQLVPPLFDLVRVNVAILRQLDQRLLALDRGHGHFRLRCRAVIPARSFCHHHLLACSIMLLLRGKSTYPSCSNLRSHLCDRHGDLAIHAAMGPAKEDTHMNNAVAFGTDEGW